MRRQTARSEFQLPHSILGRTVFAFVCLFLMPIAGFLLYETVFNFPVPRTLGGWIVAILLGLLLELLSVGLFVFSFFGLIWSLVGSEWAARWLQIGFRKLSRGAMILTITFGALIGLVFVLEVVQLIK
jgi:hypothetical protein